MSSDRKAAKDKETAFQLLLAAEVRSHPILYDQSREDYKDQEKKKDAWRAVAGKVDLKDGRNF